MRIRQAAGDSFFLFRHAVLGAAVLTAMLRLIAWFNTAIISRDSVIYVHLAKEWVTGHYDQALSHPYHPLYSFLIAWMAKVVGGNYESAAVSVSILASALTVPALALLFRKVRKKSVVFLGLMFFCVSPYLVRYAGDILSEPLYLFFVAWAAATWIEAESCRRFLFSFVSGVMTGLAYLTRPEGLLIGVASVVWLFVHWKSERTKDRLARIFLLVLGAGMFMAPYVLYLHRDTGQWLLTRKKRVGTLLHDISGQVSHPKPDRTGESLKTLLRKGVSRKRAEFLLNRKRWEQDQANKVRQAFGEVPHPKLPPGAPVWQWSLSFAVSLGMILLGFLKGMFLPLGVWVIFRFLGLKRFPWGRVDTFILIFSCLYWVILGMLLAGYGYVSRRHYTPVVMLWTLWAAMGFVEASHRIAALFRSQRWSSATVGAALLVPLLSISTVKGTRPYRWDKYGRKVVGRWIASRCAGMPCRILTSMTRIGYYAGCRTLPLSMVGEKEVDNLRRHVIEFVVLRRREERESPVLMRLLIKYRYHEVYRYVSRRYHEDLTVWGFHR